MEILAWAIRNTCNNNINNTFYNEEFIVSLYIDDTTAFMSNVSLVGNIFEILRIFCFVSGLELNESKTEGINV